MECKDGLITSDVIRSAREKYKHSFAAKKSSNHTVSTYMYGASIDKKSRFENTNDLIKEIGLCKNESDIVHSMFKSMEKHEQIIYDHKIWLKFDGEGNDRLNPKEGFPMIGINVPAGIWYLSNYPFKPSTVSEDDEIYLAAITTDLKGKNQPVIVGKGLLASFSDENHVSDEWITQYEWMTRYPWYCIIKEAKILNTSVQNGIPLDELWDKLGSDTYLTTFGRNETIKEVAMKHYQKAHLKLSGNAKEYIDLRLAELEKTYGIIYYKSDI